MGSCQGSVRLPINLLDCFFINWFDYTEDTSASRFCMLMTRPCMIWVCPKWCPPKLVVSLLIVVIIGLLACTTYAVTSTISLFAIAAIQEDLLPNLITYSAAISACEQAPGLIVELGENLADFDMEVLISLTMKCCITCFYTCCMAKPGSCMM